MALDFRAATEALFDRVRVEDLAGELHCSPQSIKQARMTEDSGGSFPAPRGRPAAAARLARKRAEHFRRLADRLGTA
jgi:hypothetical protein